MKSVLKTITRAILVIILLMVVLVTYKVVRWKAYIWLPDYVQHTLEKSEPRVDAPTHVIFLFVDHYEPGTGERAAERNREWLSAYKAMVDGHSDSYGRRPQHTWFYPFEQKNGEVMQDLTRAVYAGYGEIEFHWHHGNDTNASFVPKLEAALDWFTSYGALISVGLDTPRRFGFVHGNWALDNSRRPEHCGVSRELDILRAAGCYADFTFPSFGSVSQPLKTNSIYYSDDTDEPKSYNTGEDVIVGESRDDALMILEGPLGLTPSRQLFEYGDIASDYPPSESRVDSWVETRVGVKGRPEWVFVKIYSHGIQNRNAVLGEKMDATFTYLEENYGRGAYRLHYVTARETFNIVRAAENGLSGDPDLYRNFEVAEPVNKVFFSSVPVRTDIMSEDWISFSSETPEKEQRYLEEGHYNFRLSPITRIDGILHSLQYRSTERGRLLSVNGKGILKICSEEPLRVTPAAVLRDTVDTFLHEVSFE